MNIIRLTKLGPLHIGTGKEYYDFSSSDLHSDVLSSALASVLIEKDPKADILRFLNSFSISSAFPFWKNHYFLPKPIGKINVSVKGLQEYQFRKELKKIKYIEKPLFDKIINNEHIEVSLEQIQKEYLCSEDLVSDDKLNFKISTSQVMQRVSVSRDEQDTDPFFFNWTYFDKQGGLYCMVDCEDEIFKKITELFEILSEQGIGTDRNIGGGHFEIETEEKNIDFNYPEDANAKMLLSLFIPEKDEINSLNLDSSKYTLLLRGGYMSASEYVKFRHLRKKSIYMFGEGSCFANVDGLCGKIVDLAPDWNDEDKHPVYRSGKPFYIPIKF